MAKLRLTLTEDAPRRRVFSFNTDEPVETVSHPRFLGGHSELLANDRVIFRCGPAGARHVGLAQVSSIREGQAVLQVMALLPCGEGDT
jgi:hypothetical protein